MLKLLFSRLNEGRIFTIFLSFTQKGLAMLAFFQKCNSYPISSQCKLFFTPLRIGPGEIVYLIYAVHYTNFSILSYAIARRKNRSLIYISSKQRIFFCVDLTAFLSVNKFIKILPPTVGKRLTAAKHVFFFIGAAIKRAVIFSEFQCFYAVDLQYQICSQRSCCSQVLYFSF